ncbi:MAG: hypothetical protein A3J48_02855 [Candidatus Doudnabacteria bacterium RIFCSPHIGHO2_02_FULL_46_11]|uniref:Ribose-5-phosphate isomerase n=1 Tax=Candidatus Doudnabacteria bacterium RIFCSPHIGHO2_02_FULL_46_11 TaxID=1817832 RepID=A0A1F5P5D1_9BACT|nr:MAG: hypothetical protein A3J48_02855 [Candidatus Doudnabacteria bacterium RIFCSPHIGHO2_02_FULL_46_11]
MNIYLAADHGGFKLKEHLENILSSENHEIVDLGPATTDPIDDYPDFAFSVAQAVANEKDSLGLLLCRSGQGVCVVANKIAGVRAAVAWNEEVARAGRRDDHINVLCLPSDYVSQKEAEKIVQAWLNAKPGQDERYMRRLEKIKAIEEHSKNY